MFRLKSDVIMMTLQKVNLIFPLTNLFDKQLTINICYSISPICTTVGIIISPCWHLILSIIWNSFLSYWTYYPSHNPILSSPVSFIRNAQHCRYSILTFWFWTGSHPFLTYLFQLLVAQAHLCGLSYHLLSQNVFVTVSLPLTGIIFNYTVP